MAEARPLLSNDDLRDEHALMSKPWRHPQRLPLQSRRAFADSVRAEIGLQLSDSRVLVEDDRRR